MDINKINEIAASIAAIAPTLTADDTANIERLKDLAIELFSALD